LDRPEALPAVLKIEVFPPPADGEKEFLIRFPIFGGRRFFYREIGFLFLTSGGKK
jgi:hypothetical protein